MGKRLRPTEEQVGAILEGPISWDILEEHEDDQGFMVVDKVRVLAGTITLEDTED